MTIGLISVDGHSGFPNLALMRLSAYHKARGDVVEWWDGFKRYDRVYMSKVFTFSPDVETVINLWTSEIGEFPAAVTKKRFCGK